MSAELLRTAAEMEREEWGDPDTRRVFPKASAIHLALADLLDEAAQWGCAFDGDEKVHALARLIVGEQS